MEMQLRFVTKEEAHKLIDESPGNGIYVLTYKNTTGISNTGQYIKKKEGKKMVDKAKILILSEDEISRKINLHKFFESFPNYRREKTMKSILLPKLE